MNPASLGGPKRTHFGAVAGQTGSGMRLMSQSATPRWACFVSGSPAPHTTQGCYYRAGCFALLLGFFFFSLLAIVEKSFFTYSSDLNLLGCACRKLPEATSSHVSLSSCHLPWRGSGHLFLAAARDDTAPSALPCGHPPPPVLRP